MSNSTFEKISYYLNYHKSNKKMFEEFVTQVQKEFEEGENYPGIVIEKVTDEEVKISLLGQSVVARLISLEANKLFRSVIEVSRSDSDGSSEPLFLVWLDREGYALEGPDDTKQIKHLTLEFHWDFVRKMFEALMIDNKRFLSEN